MSMLHRGKFTPLALILVACPLWAQETTGTAVGRITSKAGKPLPGAVVRLASPRLLGERIATTNENGQYRIALLPNGMFTITVTASGFMTVKGQFQVVPGQSARQDAILTPVVEQGTTVEVIDLAAQVDKTTTTTASTFSMENLNQLATQELDSIVVLSPGITGTLDPNVGGYGDDAISIRGGIQHSTKVIQNGLNITEEGGGYLNELTTLMDMVETMAVIQSPLNARYGNTDGGLVSIVTTRGSNTFTGTARIKYRKNFWQDNNTSYPRRDGSPGDPAYPNDDFPNRTYEFSVRGPIWKDHITFAYGTQQTPSYSYTSPVGNTTLNGLPSQATFTFVPGTGIVPANTYAMGALDTLEDTSKFHQFVLFMQINPDHSLEWNYTQNDSAAYWGLPRFGRIDTVASSGTDNYHHHLWNLGYKGLIGSEGVLEARVGHTYRTWPHPYSPGLPPIWTTFIPGEHADGTPVTSLLDGYTAGGTAYNINGYNADKGDTILNDSAIVNYSHVFTQGASSHVLDVGLDVEKFQWGIQVGAARDQYIVPGQNPQTGQYLVYNAATATLNDLDPTYGNTPVLSDGLVNPGYGAPGSDNHFPGGLGLIPTWVSRTGAEGGNFQKTTHAYWINDLWTLNRNHSVMLGLRYDVFKVNDDFSTFVSYGHLNPRFEYKWDIAGDQSRLVNLSYGQFQASSPGSLFLPMAHGRLGDQTIYYWNQGTATPYYVSYDQLLNKNNYTVYSRTYAGDTFIIDPSWKNPVSQEITLGFRRSYPNGGYWRATGVYKTWSNLFDFFPGEVYTDPSGSPNFKRVLRNDPDSERTYKSVELEWMLPLNRRFSLYGNYTFARMMANTRYSLDNPDRTTSQLANFRDYYNTLFTRSQYDPNTLRMPEHNLNLFVMFDLTQGKVKSNISLHANYTSGKPEGRWINYNIPFPTVPGYYEPNNPNVQSTGGLPNSLGITADGNRMTNTDLTTIGMKYNLEVTVWRTVKWFCDLNISNVFNVKPLGPYSLGGTSLVDTVGQPSQYTGHGWRASDDLSTVGTGRIPGRLIILDTGIRF
jgi:hypothetical protein